jgi:uncharacterized membrane protein
MSNSHTISRPGVFRDNPKVRKIGPSDLKQALAEGLADFSAMRSHLVFLGLIYPIAGIWLIMGNPLPLLFPLLSGFALIGPFAAIGLYEVSRRREPRHPGKTLSAWYAHIRCFQSCRSDCCCW